MGTDDNIAYHVWNGRERIEGSTVPGGTTPERIVELYHAGTPLERAILRENWGGIINFDHTEQRRQERNQEGYSRRHGWD